jgi:hypothetical protein
MYEESADLLMAKASDAPGLLNVHAIPAVYLFRHFVELSLKNMLAMAGRLANQDGSYPDKHRLEPLWVKLRALLHEAGLPESDDERRTLDIVGAMIRELDNADGTAMGFRYPVGTSEKDGSRSVLLGDDFEYFDMRAFRDQAQRLANFIAGCTDQLDVYLGMKDEMDQEYRHYLRDEW